MNLKNIFAPFRSAAYLLVLYCLLHTAGGMRATRSFGAEADAVFDQMKTVQFVFNGSPSTWYGFWFGFGIMFSVFLILSAVIAWQLNKVAPAAWSNVSVIAWALCLAHLVTAFLSWKYFFLAPALFGVAISSLTAYGAYRKAG